MKTFSSLFLLATAASGAVIQSRQFSVTGMLAGLLPGIDGVVRESSSTLRKDAKRQIVRYGPFTLPASKINANSSAGHGGHKSSSESMAMSGGSNGGGGISDILGALQTTMDPNGITMVKRLATGFCKDCTVLQGEVRITFEDGSPADVKDGVYLHHITVLDASKPSQTYITDCGNMASKVVAFITAGIDGTKRDFTSPDGKYPSGFYIGQDTFVMQAEFVNYRPVEQKVYVDMDIQYVPGKVGVESVPMKLSATDCSSFTLSYKPKPGEAGQLKSKVYPVLHDGVIVVPHGHMHDGGVAVSMFINDKMICKSNASYASGDSGTITNMSYCNDSYPVKKGDQITVTADYDLTAHPARESQGEGQEIMGMMFFVFAPS